MCKDVASIRNERDRRREAQRLDEWEAGTSAELAAADSHGQRRGLAAPLRIAVIVVVS